MNIEARLIERIGEAGKRLHTARSRNDQVATDFRLWVRDAIDGLDAQVGGPDARAGGPRGGASRRTRCRASPTCRPRSPSRFGHHLLAYVEMLARDRGRLADCRAAG